MNSYWLSRVSILSTLLAFLLTPHLLALGWGEFKTADGVVYEDVVVKTVEETGIVVVHKGGVARLNFLELPPSIQGQFKFDRDKADRALLLRKSQEQAAQKKVQEMQAQEAAAKAASSDQQKALERKQAEAMLDKLAAGKLKVQKDRFDGTTKITFDDVAFDSWISVSAVCKISEDGHPVFLMMFHRQAPYWSWMYHEGIYMLVDGERLFQKDKASTGVIGGRVSEIMSMDLSEEQIEKLIKAKRWAFKIGSDEFDFTDTHKLPLTVVYLKYKALTAK